MIPTKINVSLESGVFTFCVSKTPFMHDQIEGNRMRCACWLKICVKLCITVDKMPNCL